MKNLRIRVLVVDDYLVIREGVRCLLEHCEDIIVVGEACDGQGALVEARRLLPDVLLLDMKMPGMDGVETTIALRQCLPEVAVLLFSSFAEEAQLRAALSAGALGYILKDTLHEDLARAVRAVAAGEAWLHPLAQRQILDWFRRPPSLIDKLNGRERDVLALLAQGFNNQRIAGHLFLSEGTIKGHVGQLLSKLQVEDRTQAALLAQRAGLAFMDGTQGFTERV